MAGSVLGAALNGRAPIPRASGGNMIDTLLAAAILSGLGLALLVDAVWLAG